MQKRPKLGILDFRDNSSKLVDIPGFISPNFLCISIGTINFTLSMLQFQICNKFEPRVEQEENLGLENVSARKSHT